LSKSQKFVDSEFRRTSPRKPTTLVARLRVLSTPYQVTVLDLSATGFRFESIYRFAIGARCTLKIDTFETLGATLIWMDGGVAGCLFERPLHPSVVDAIAARHPSIDHRHR
jgi:PilZ domain